MERKTSITVRGHKVSARTQRRFLLVAVREHDLVTAEGTFVAFAHIQKRSDNFETIKTARRRLAADGMRRDIQLVIVDLATGEEI